MHSRQSIEMRAKNVCRHLLRRIRWLTIRIEYAMKKPFLRLVLLCYVKHHTVVGGE